MSEDPERLIDQDFRDMYQRPFHDWNFDDTKSINKLIAQYRNYKHRLQQGLKNNSSGGQYNEKDIRTFRLYIVEQLLVDLEKLV